VNAGAPWQSPVDPGPDADPDGQVLLRARIAAAPAVVAAALALPLPEWPAAARRLPWIVTGIGSSETHARLLIRAVDQAGGPMATFWPLERFLSSPHSDLSQRFLVIFSQGLSPNCRPALAAAASAGGAALFTATTPAGARSAGKPERAALIESWQEAGHRLFPLLPEEEYAILIRVLGPLAGTVAVLRAAAALLPGVPPPPADLAARLAEAALRLEPMAPALLPHLAIPLLLIGDADLSSYGQNLAYKFLEGLFLPQPALVDWLQFAHGSFQQRCAHPGPVIVLRNNSAHDTAAWQRAEPLLRRCARPLLVHQATLPAPWCLLEHEAALNGLIASLAGPLAINQRNWPGHGEDAPLYGWQE